MKRYILLICLLGMVARVQSAAEYRDFTNTEGKVIRGCIKAYDPRSKTVTIEFDNKHTAKAQISAFCGEDQDYILEWKSSKFFYDSKALKITADKRRIDQRKEKEWRDVRYTSGDVEKQLMNEKTYESILYDIEFYSRNEADLTNLRLVYIIYYEQSEMSWEKPEVVQKTKRGELSIPLIKSRNKAKVETESVEIYRDNVSQRAWISDKNRTGGEGNVHGLRARLFMTLPSGKQIVRDFSYPEKLSLVDYPWKD